MTQTLFYILAGIIVASAFLVVTLRNLFHSALALALTMFGISGVYLYLGWEFLAAVQVLIYVGAITILIIFGIMLTRKVMDDNARVMNRQVFLSVLAALAVAGILFSVIGRTPLGPEGKPSPAAYSQAGGPTGVQGQVPEGVQNDVNSLAEALLRPQNGFLFAFEFVSILLLSALVGAMVVARKDPE